MHEIDDPWHDPSMEHDEFYDLVHDLETVNLTTIGIDVGSSTSHLMISEVELQRLAQRLSSRFVVVSRVVRFRSDILLTPFRPDGLIDADLLGAFVRKSYEEAGLTPSEIDTGAVILTGEALKRANSRAIADLFAAEGGRFVCASAGHLLEAHLAANGSGVLPLSKEGGLCLLNIDMGGGTTKLALVRNGKILETAAIAVGGRLIAYDDDGRVNRIEEEGRLVASDLGIEVELGKALAVEDRDAIARRLAEVLAKEILNEPQDELGEALRLTPRMHRHVEPEALTFSGGVAEYVYGREERRFGDLAPMLAESIRAALEDRAGCKILEIEQGIRATVTGASQFSFQVSGNTVRVSNPETLPFHNLPVTRPQLRLGASIDPHVVAHALDHATELQGEPGPIRAIGLSWEGPPTYARIAALAEGIKHHLDQQKSELEGVVVLLDADLGRALGRILIEELGFSGHVVCLDGIELGEFDFVDVGTMLEPSKVVPVIIKSLVF